MKNRLRPWELALIMALAVTFCAGFWADRTQKALSDEMIRLHVVANSDSPADQAAKLEMRDRVLAYLAPQLSGCRTRDEAVSVIEKSIPALEALGGVSVSIGQEYYPTRTYDTFSLPAGRYVSLRVIMGEGRGHNWWCVVYPALCTEALADSTEDAFLSLDGSQRALITQDGEEYELRFRVVEWWGMLEELIRGA